MLSFNVGDTVRIGTIAQAAIAVDPTAAFDVNESDWIEARDLQLDSREVEILAHGLFQHFTRTYVLSFRVDGDLYELLYVTQEGGGN